MVASARRARLAANRPAGVIVSALYLRSRMPKAERGIEVIIGEGTPRSLDAYLRANLGNGIASRRQERGRRSEDTGLHSVDPISATLLLLFLGGRSIVEGAGEWFGWLAKAPEVVTLYLKTPGIVVGGAVAGKLAEFVIETTIKWARQRAGRRHTELKIILYGPDGQILTTRHLNPRADRKRRLQP